MIDMIIGVAGKGYTIDVFTTMATTPYSGVDFNIFRGDQWNTRIWAVRA